MTVTDLLLSVLAFRLAAVLLTLGVLQILPPHPCGIHRACSQGLAPSTLPAVPAALGLSRDAGSIREMLTHD